MIPTIKEEMNSRELHLHQFTRQYLPFKNGEWSQVSGDASFRKYFRWQQKGPSKDALKSIIAVDAPPHLEDINPFIKIAQHMKLSGIDVPEILQADESQGFMLITDLGDRLLLDELNDSNVDYWYQKAIQQIYKIQDMGKISGYLLPRFSKQLMNQEMNYLPKWYLAKHLKSKPDSKTNAQLDLIFAKLVEVAQKQPQVVVHLDFHSRNLMVLKNDELGILDFQDMNYGPISYDLISLIKDCYIKWPTNKVEQWMRSYNSENERLKNISDDEFIYWADMMSLQRHIKVVGIFSRLYCRDGKKDYLVDIPNVLAYIEDTLEKHSCFRWLKSKVCKEWLPQTYIQNKKILEGENEK